MPRMRWWPLHKESNRSSNYHSYNGKCDGAAAPQVNEIGSLLWQQQLLGRRPHKDNRGRFPSHRTVGASSPRHTNLTNTLQVLQQDSCLSTLQGPAAPSVSISKHPPSRKMTAVASHELRAGSPLFSPRYNRFRVAL